MDRRYALKIVFGAWLLLIVLMPWSAQAQQPAADPLAPEIAPAAAPSCARWTSTHIDCFVIGSDNRIWMLQWNDGAAQWGAWLSVPQPPAQIDPLGGLSVTMRGLQVEIFVVARSGSYGDLYRLTWTGSNWTPWQNQSGPGLYDVYEISCTSRTTTSLDCFARVSDNHLWQKSWDGASWGAWTDLGAFPSASGLGGLAATTYGSGFLVVYAIGSDGHAYRRYYETSWSTWQDDGFPSGIQLRQVGCATLNATTIECAFTDVDGGAWYRRWTGGPSGWSAFADLGFPPSYARGVTVANYLNDGVVVLANASDGRFYRKFREPGLTTWSGWLDLGRPKDVRVFIPTIIR
jgi:hypothetical protein